MFFCIGELLIDFVAEKQGSDLSKAMIYQKRLVVLLQMLPRLLQNWVVKSFFYWLCGQRSLWQLFLYQPRLARGTSGRIPSAEVRHFHIPWLFVSLAADGEKRFLFLAVGCGTKIKRMTADCKNLFKDQICRHFGAANIILWGAVWQRRIHFISAKRPFPANSFISFDPNFQGRFGKDGGHLYTNVSLYRKNPIVQI